MQNTAPPQLRQTEFIAMIAMLFATVAFGIDSMLPALPEIAAELTPASPNRAQLIVTSFVLGMGIGTLFSGPLSDSFGRKRVIVAGAGLYCLAAFVAFLAPTLETLLAARLVMGLGAAGPRIVSMALVRDLHKGREMARIVSFAMMIFTLVPAVAPMMGVAVISLGGWRALFIAFMLFMLTAAAWVSLRQPETLPPAARRPFHARPLWEALREVLGHAMIRKSILVQSLVFACLFATISSIQPIFEQNFGRGEEFPYWFALIALVAGSASLLNSQLVMKIGMRRVVAVTLAVEMVFSLMMAAIGALDLWPLALQFPAFLIWAISVFFMTGLVIGNLNAMAMEPVGHIAGMAASVMGALATVVAVVLAVPVGLAFDGTPLPLMAGIAAFTVIGWGVMRTMQR